MVRNKVVVAAVAIATAVAQDLNAPKSGQTIKNETYIDENPNTVPRLNQKH